MKHSKRSYRLDIEAKDFEDMRSTGMKAPLKELLQSAQVWGALEKWEGRWVNKGDKKKQDSLEVAENVQQDKNLVKILPMREIPGRNFDHVPWSRSDILSFMNDYPKLREKPVEWYQQTDRFVKLAKCLWASLSTFQEIVVPADLWFECKRSVERPTSERERDKAIGALPPEVMKYYYKVIEFLKTRILPKNLDWQRIDRTVQEVKESVHVYCEKLLKAFKEHSGKEAIEPKDMLHFVFRFVEGLRPEIGQMIKSHLICWQAKPIAKVLQYAKYCSDEIELKQKLKEKAMVLQIKAAQTGVQGRFVQQILQQQGIFMFQSQTNSDDEEVPAPVTECETTNEEYPLIEFFPIFTEKELHSDLQGTVQENVWDLTGKVVGLIKGEEPVKVTLKPNAVFPQLPQYNMTQDVLMKVAQIIADFVKQGVLKEVLSCRCNSLIMGLKKPCGKVRIVQDLRKINEMVVKCCLVVPNPAVIMLQIPCDAEWFKVVDLSQAFLSVPLHDAEWFKVVDLSQAFLSVPLHEDSNFFFCFKFLD
ncbi:hypothetical protein NDU88_007575 [Pleurodeles waltl]|uniref:Uncharacterized protein n=1 Tax=Pleurodeles waltl TaxID=8319 RepID=A0AAV7U0V6_PLEWA|nr:hypothetical protein NDU88_007575 [Pleurodeles waltl]